MPSFFALLKRCYKALPAPVRHSSLILPLTRYVVHRTGNHQDIYDSDYFERYVEPLASASAPVMAESIVAEFNPASVVDVGCGTGALLAALQRAGLECLGLDYSEASLRMAQARGLRVEKLDLCSASPGPRHFDVAISVEVAEHLPERCVDRYVDYLCHLAPAIVFTAATPGQGGWAHLNEQPHEFWIAKFRDRGFELVQEVSERWRHQWKRSNVAWFYHTNVMILHRMTEG
jgi:SAM-dependent methyltransferase